MRRLLLVVAVVLVAAVALPLAGSAGAGTPSLTVFRRPGAWVDVFDYAPRLQKAGTAPRVTPDSVSDMAALGVKTLYVQVANPDGAPSNQLTDRAELRALLERAHEHGVAVVPWFLPVLTSPADDLTTMKQILALRAGGEKVDGIGLDLESTDVADIPLRNQRTVAFAKRVRKLVGSSMPVAAIVYPAVQLEVLNTTLWPAFPYMGVAKSVDLWMPMSYYTYRSNESGLRNAYRYTVDSVDRLRRHLGDDAAPVHIIGGLAAESTPDDYLDLERAARATDALGWSVYDYVTTGSWAWPYVRGDVPVPTTLLPPTTPAPSTVPPKTSSTSSTTTSSTTSPPPST
ncbi:MAG: hypothetical protein QOF40_2007 [Actinomycetota bacterium]|nr:hypothetical protein [Actinomycetota bacterium]